jgi:CBS domain-containing protein
MSSAVVTLSPNDSVAKSVDLLAKGDFRHLVIADDEQRVLGVISDRDILSVKGRISDWHSKRLRDAMTANPLTVTPDTPLSAAVSTMLSRKINCLPVLDRAGKLCGIVTSTDIMKICQNLLEATD